MLGAEFLTKARELADGYHRLGRQAGTTIWRGAELVFEAAGGKDGTVTETLVEDVAFMDHKGFPNNGVALDALVDLVVYDDVPAQLRAAASEKSSSR